MATARPIWCEDKICTPLCQMTTLGGGQCRGKLAVPTDHVSKAANTMSRCLYDKVSKSVHAFDINPDDIIVETYLGGEAMRAMGLALPNAIIDNLPRGG